MTKGEAIKALKNAPDLSIDSGAFDDDGRLVIEGFVSREELEAVLVLWDDWATNSMEGLLAKIG